MDTLGIDTSPEEIDLMIHEIDQDSNGEIDFEGVCVSVSVGFFCFFFLFCPFFSKRFFCFFLFWFLVFFQL